MSEHGRPADGHDSLLRRVEELEASVCRKPPAEWTWGLAERVSAVEKTVREGERCRKEDYLDTCKYVQALEAEVQELRAQVRAIRAHLSLEAADSSEHVPEPLREPACVAGAKRCQPCGPPPGVAAALPRE